MNYIWQNKNWPHFQWNIEELLPLLAEARKKQGVLASSVDLVEFEHSQYNRIDDLIRPLNREKFFTWAKQVAVHNEDILRSTFTVYEMDAAYIPAELNRLVKWFNHSSSVADNLIKAGICYLWCISISPFSTKNENEHVSCQLADLALAQDEKSSVRYYNFYSVLKADQQKYHQALHQVQTGDLNITVWLKWFLKIYINALDHSILDFKSYLRKIEYWTAWNTHSLNPRQKKILQSLLDGHEQEITNRKYVALIETSAESAKRDLVDLTQKDILVKGLAKGRSTSYALKKI